MAMSLKALRSSKQIAPGCRAQWAQLAFEPGCISPGPNIVEGLLTCDTPCAGNRARRMQLQVYISTLNTASAILAVIADARDRLSLEMARVEPRSIWRCSRESRRAVNLMVHDGCVFTDGS
jgi:hypothetical protein